MAKRGYNPVSNPNPQVDPGREPTGIVSQGHDGNIVGRVHNIRYQDGVPYGEDAFGDDDGWDD
jgi:hypothetical protein